MGRRLLVLIAAIGLAACSSNSGSSSGGNGGDTTAGNGSTSGQSTAGTTGASNGGSTAGTNSGTNGGSTGGINAGTSGGSNGGSNGGTNGSAGTGGGLACTSGVYGFGLPVADLGTNPLTMRLVDVNGDQHPDVVVANGSAATVSVLTGYGDGTFATRSSFDVSSSPQGLAVAEFTGDSNLDIAVGDTNYYGTITVLKGFGTGAFTTGYTLTPSDLPTSTGYFSPYSLASADLNGDGRADLIAGNSRYAELAVYYGQAGGGLDADGGVIVGTASGYGFRDLAVGDFNGDQKPDIAAVTNGSVKLFLNSGGGLAPQSGELTLPGDSVSIAAADLNHDNKVDLVVGGSGQVSVFKGQGNAAFASAVNLSSSLPGSQYLDVQVADIDHDENPDIVASEQYSNLVEVFYGDGNGGFSRTAIFDTGEELSIATGDVNGDGRDDLLTGTNDGLLQVSLANPDGTLLAGRYMPGTTSTNPSTVASADLNGDGLPDLVELNPDDQAFTLFLSNSSSPGTFQAPVPYSLAVGSNPAGLAVADFTGDGKADVVVANSGTLTVELRPGDGRGTLGQPKSTSVSGMQSSSRGQALAYGDFNHDGKLDVAVIDATNTVWVLPNAPSGTSQFGTPQQVSLPNGAYPIAIVAGHFSGGTSPDLAVLDSSTHQVITLLNDGNGAFPTSGTTSLYSSGYALSLVPGNGSTDGLVVSEYGAAEMLSNPNAGSFTKLSAPSDSNGGLFSLADLNGDQKLDLVGSSPNSAFEIFLGQTGGYGNAITFPANSTNTEPPRVIDLNNDGRPDVVMTTNAGLSYWLNSCWPTP